MMHSKETPPNFSIRKLRHHEETLDLAAAPSLIFALAKRASNIPISRDIVFGTFVLSQSAIFVCQLARRMEAAQQDAILAKAAEDTDSLCLYYPTHAVEPRTIHGRSGSRLPDTLRDCTQSRPFWRGRFFAAADESNIIDCAGDRFGELAFAVLRDGDEATKALLQERLSAFLEAAPQNALLLLKVSVVGHRAATVSSGHLNSPLTPTNRSRRCLTQAVYMNDSARYTATNSTRRHGRKIGG